MATRSSILAWKSLWTEEPGRLQFLGLQRVRHDLVTEHSQTHNICTYIYNAGVHANTLQSFLTLFQPRVAHQAPLSMEFSRQE